MLVYFLRPPQQSSTHLWTKVESLRLEKDIFVKTRLPTSPIVVKITRVVSYLARVLPGPQ